MADVMYKPFVYWAQTESVVTLQVDLKNVQNPDIILDGEHIRFSAKAYGACGNNFYEFTMEFFQPINSGASVYRITDRQVDFTLKKSDPCWWPRLTHSKTKLSWLKIDFDKWKSEDDDDDDDEDEHRDVFQDYPNVYENLKNMEGYGVLKRHNWKMIYLFLYNMWQFVGYTYIITILMIQYMRFGEDSIPYAYASVGSAMKFCQLIQFLEVLHPLFGYTEGGIIHPLMQVCGRNFVIFLMIESESRMQEKPVVFYLFMVYSLIEVIRYPYYLVRVVNRDIGLITWLRYTMWIPLYPLGFVCEGVIILRSIPYFEETNRFTVSMPNKWNFAFHFPSLLRIYLLFFCFPAIYALMMHMYRRRARKLGHHMKRKKN